MYIKTPISTPPPIGEWVVVIDQEENMFIARFTEFEVNYRDLSGTNTPSNNIALTHWLKKVDQPEFKLERVERYYHHSGRNSKTYKEVSFWYNSITLDRKETVRDEYIMDGQEYKLPEWAKSCVYRKDLNY